MLAFLLHRAASRQSTRFGVVLRSVLLLPVFAAALIAAGAHASLARPARAAGTGFVAGHLFVSSADADALLGADVYRYKLANGVPSAKPDLVYFYGSSSGAMPAFTVTRQGVASFILCCFYAATFGKNGNLRFTWGLVQPFDDVAFPGLLDDGSQTLVDYLTLPSSMRSRGSAASARCTGTDAPLVGIDIYGAYQPKRYARRLDTCFAVNEQDPDFVGLAAANDDVFVPNASEVDVYGPLSGQPAQLRTLTGPSFKSVRAVAIDDGLLYTLAGKAYSYIAVYDAGGSGLVKPLRTIAFPSLQHWYGNIAVDSRYVYIGADQAVLVYPKGTNGRQQPFATLEVPNSHSGSVGPWIAIGP
jgi:hypothetical protein